MRDEDDQEFAMELIAMAEILLNERRPNITPILDKASHLGVTKPETTIDEIEDVIEELKSQMAPTERNSINWKRLLYRVQLEQRAAEEEWQRLQTSHNVTSTLARWKRLEELAVHPDVPDEWITRSEYKNRYGRKAPGEGFLWEKVSYSLFSEAIKFRPPTDYEIPDLVNPHQLRRCILAEERWEPHWKTFLFPEVKDEIS